MSYRGVRYTGMKLDERRDSGADITSAWLAHDIMVHVALADGAKSTPTGCIGQTPLLGAPNDAATVVLWPLYPVLPEQFVFMQIIVRDNNVDQALRALKKKLQREGVYREMKLRRHYEKPSEKRARERAAAVRRARKLERKRAERDGAR